MPLNLERDGRFDPNADWRDTNDRPDFDTRHIDWPDGWSLHDAYWADAWPERLDWVRLPDGRVRPVLRVSGAGNGPRGFV